MTRESKLEYQQWERLVARQQLVSSAGISCDGHAAFRAKCLQQIEASGSNLPKASAPLRSSIAKQEQGGVTVQW
ncbi:hypothetical protein [Synechococcus sp. RS9902]|uniref:hypothetical protein n=1 Tax=Synechococcus sp. RS9902 TaxID=221345 RepID=UPI0016496ACB|nr:hypothetical protein [Synechococcus sp. RS9902]